VLFTLKTRNIKRTLLVQTDKVNTYNRCGRNTVSITWTREHTYV